MKIALGADHGGFGLKEEIKRHLEEKGDYELEDLGTFDEASVDYPDYGAAVAGRWPPGRRSGESWSAAQESGSVSQPTRSKGFGQPFAATCFLPR